MRTPPRGAARGFSVMRGSAGWGRFEIGAGPLFEPERGWVSKLRKFGLVIFEREIKIFFFDF